MDKIQGDKSQAGKRGTLIPFLRWIICLLAVTLLADTGAWAKPTTPEQAKSVVQNWLGLEAAPMGSPLGGQIREVQTYNDSDGNPAYYVVFLNPSGLVFLPADDLVEPIIGFVSGATSYDPSPFNRLGRLISGDIPARVLQARQMAARVVETAAPLAPLSPQAAAQSKWSLLAASSPTREAAPTAGGPVIYYISPSTQSPGTFTVSLFGANFTGVTDVVCSNQALSFNWTFVSDAQITITATFPLGTYTFRVTTPNGGVTSPTLTVGQFGLSSLSDVRVAPFFQVRWGRTTLDGHQAMPPFPYSLPCYNYFTPPYPAGSDYNYLNYPVGALAMAQLMRFWQYPTAGVGTTLYTITVDGGESCWPLRGGDGLGGPYDWANMPLDPSNPLATDLQRQAIGNLCHDADLSVNMDYEWTYNGSTGYEGTDSYRMADVAKALVETFKYGNAMAGGNAGDNIPCTNRDTMIIPNLHAGYPVLLGETSTGGGVFFDMVCDGYGYNLNSIYHHLHMGSGYGAWFNLPLVYLSPSDKQWQFNILTDIIYNVYPTGSGEIIAGRVTDSLGHPVNGATVTATRMGGGAYTGATNANGIYAIVKVPSASTYSVTASTVSLSFAPQTVTTGTSVSNSLNTGNVVLDFGLSNTLNQALDNYTLGFSTGGGANWFSESTTYYYGDSAAQSGAINNGQSTTLQTAVSGPGTLSFYWSVSSTPVYNSLNLYLDGSSKGAISGLGGGWSLKTLSIPAGVHTVSWTYSKVANVSGVQGSDCAWVDKVVFTRATRGKIGPVLDFLLMN